MRNREEIEKEIKRCRHEVERYTKGSILYNMFTVRIETMKNFLNVKDEQLIEDTLHDAIQFCEFKRETFDFMSPEWREWNDKSFAYQWIQG